MALNVFKIEQIKGRIDLRNSANNVIQAFFDENSTEVTDLVVGEFVIFTQTQTTNPINEGPIPIDRMTDTAQTPLGVIPYGLRINTYAKGEDLSVAADGMVVVLETEAAIARGASVEYNPATQQVRTLAAGTKVGEAFDVATAVGDLIRIKIAIG